MNIKILLAFLAVAFIACSDSNDHQAAQDADQKKAETTFDREKWSIKDGDEYPYREQMLRDVVYHDTIRSLSEAELLNLLGSPDRRNDGHLYYRIARKNLGPLTLHETTMVVKMADDQSIEWIRIHE